MDSMAQKPKSGNTRDAIINMLSRKAGRDVTTPHGSEWLCQDIMTRTGEQISINTVKRLTGVLSNPANDDNLHARRSTLDIIAKYLGYRDMPMLRHYLKCTAPSLFRKMEGMVYMDELSVNSEVVICWNPDRRLCLRHLGKGWYEVEGAENSKLLPADRLSISQAMQGYPLMVREVLRGEESLRPYTAAPEFGITLLKVNQNPDKTIHASE